MAESYVAWLALGRYLEPLPLGLRNRITQHTRPPLDENDTMALFDSAGVPRFQTGDGQSFYNPPLVLEEVTSSDLNHIAVISVNWESVTTLARRVCDASIARGITVLMVDLSFRSKSLTENKTKFGDQICTRLRELKKAAKTIEEKNAIADYSVKCAKDGYKTSMEDLHEAYKDAYTAQTELLESGEFMKHLRECIEKMPNLNRLCFMQNRDIMESLESPETTDGKPIRRVSRELFDLKTEEGIEQYLVKHHDFVDLEIIERAEEAGPGTSRLFIDVLSACHSAKRQLRFLKMYCFPRRAHMSEAEEPSEAVWAGIEEVSKSLEAFALLTDASTPLREYTSDSMDEMSHPHTRRFIKAAL